MAGQQQQGDDSLGIVWVMALIIAVVGIIWFYGHAHIVNFVIDLKTLESRFLTLFNKKFLIYVVQLQGIDPNNVSWDQMNQVASKISWYFKYPAMFCIAVCAYFVYKKNTAGQFKKKYNMKVLAQEESINWPQICPILKLDLEKQDIMKGPWSMALNPIEFTEKHKILIIEKGQSNKRDDIKIRLDIPKAKDVLIKQLGPGWEGIQNIPPHTQALFAIFAARINRDRDNAGKLLNQLAISSTEGKLNISGVQSLLDKYLSSKIVERIVKKHAYVLTVMAGMIKAARNDGVLASADFLWLKPVDRTLWYMLNSVGRQTPYIEVAGPYGHWISENTFQQAIRSPMIDTAIKAIEVALSETKYRPKED